MASRQIEAGENERDSLYQEIQDYQVENKKQSERITKLENAIQGALGISDLWLPEQGELISGEHTGEAQALATMHSMFKQLMKKEGKNEFEFKL